MENTRTHDGEIRRSSKRRRSLDNDATAAATEPLYRPFNLSSGRTVDSCILWGFPKSFCCAGCCTFADSAAGLDIDNRDHDTAMVLALSKRKRYKSKKYLCTTPWKKTLDKFDISQATMVKAQKDFIRDVRVLDPDRLELFDDGAATTFLRRRSASTDPMEVDNGAPVGIPVAAATVPATPFRIDASSSAAAPSTPQATATDAAVVTDSSTGVTTSPAKSKKPNLHRQTFSSGGKQFDFDIPKTHVVVPLNHLNALKNDRESLKKLKANTNLARFSKNADDLVKSYLAIALAAVPAFAITTCSYVLPLLVTAFLQHFGLADKMGKNFNLSFPSAATLRKMMVDQAAHGLVWLAHELRGKKVYLSCDKGKLSQL